MPKVEIKIPKKLHRVEVIRSEELVKRELEAYIPVEEKKPAPREQEVIEEELEDIIEDNELFEEEFIEQVLEEPTEPEEYIEPETKFFDYYSICLPDRPVGISLDKVPLEETLPLSEVRDEVQHAYDRGFDDAQQLTTNTFETQILKLQERVKQFDSVVLDLKDKFSTEMDNVAKSISDVSIMIAEHILGRELLSDPDIVIGQVKKAIESLEKDEIFKIHVHPDNVSLLEEVRLTLDYDRSRMENVLIIPDESVDHGGCILYTSAGIIDARIESQLEQLSGQLSQVTLKIEDKEKSIPKPEETPVDEVDMEATADISDEEIDNLEGFDDLDDFDDPDELENEGL